MIAAPYRIAGELSVEPQERQASFIDYVIADVVALVLLVGGLAVLAVCVFLVAVIGCWAMGPTVVDPHASSVAVTCTR